MIGSAEWSRKTDPCGNRHRAGLTGYHLWCPCPDLTRYRLAFRYRDGGNYRTCLMSPRLGLSTGFVGWNA